jgi:hypothetical protein
VCTTFRSSSAANAIRQLPTYTGQDVRRNSSRHASTTKVRFEPTLRCGQHMCRCQCKVVIVHAMKVHRGNRDVALLILYLGTRGRYVSFMPRPLHPPRKEHRYPFNRLLGMSQCRSGWFGEQTNILHLPGFETRIVQPRCLATILHKTHRLRPCMLQ